MAEKETIDYKARAEVEAQIKICKLNIKNFNDHMSNLQEQIVGLSEKIEEYHDAVKNGMSDLIADKLKKKLFEEDENGVVVRKSTARTRKKDISNWSKATKILSILATLPVIGIFLVGLFRVIGEGFIWLSTTMEGIFK